MPKNRKGPRKNNRNVSGNTTEGSTAVAKRTETEEEREERMQEKMLSMAARKEKQVSSKAVRLACRDDYKQNFGQKYQPEEQQKNRAAFLKYIKESKPQLLTIEDNLGRIKSTLITYTTKIVSGIPTTEKYNNIELILKHSRELYDHMQQYETSQTDAMATEIVHQMRHISGKIKTNYAFYRSSELGEIVNGIYKESCSSKPKNAGVQPVENFQIDETSWENDKKLYYAVCKMINPIAENKILYTMREMIRVLVPQRNFDLWEQEIKTRNTNIASQRQDRKEEKAKTIALKRKRAASAQTPLLGDETETQLSTEALLMQMKSMQLSM
jgi:hypothetical protein